MRYRYYHTIINWSDKASSPSNYLNYIRSEYHDVFEIEGAFHPASDSSLGHIHVLIKSERSVDPALISAIFAVPLISLQPVLGLVAYRRWEKYIIGAKGARRI